MGQQAYIESTHQPGPSLRLIPAKVAHSVEDSEGVRAKYHAEEQNQRQLFS